LPGRGWFIYFRADGSRHGFRREASGAIANIDVAEQTHISAINNHNWITGAYFDAAGVGVGFVQRGEEIIELRGPDSPLTLPISINDHGDVAGWYFDAAGVRHGFVATLRAN
jgi:hypothetical protein